MFVFLFTFYSENSKFCEKEKVIFLCYFSSAETRYSQIFNTNRSLVYECAHCGSLATPSCQGSYFSLCACNPNAFSFRGDAVILNLRLSCSTSPDVLILCFILEKNNKTKSCLLTMEEGDSVFLRTGRKCFLFVFVGAALTFLPNEKANWSKVDACSWPK